ncbi:MAG: IclR family transcriptional regulator [Pseudorhodoplanes sp.]
MFTYVKYESRPGVVGNLRLKPSSASGAGSDGVAGVKSALRVLAIFEFFAATGKPATLTDLAERLDLPKSSCFALMETLRREGYVYSLGKRNGYFPTSRLRVLGDGILRGDSVLVLAQPHLQSLRDATGETVMFGKLDGAEVLYLDVKEADLAVRFAAHTGQRKMIHSSASGRAVLGLLPSDERRKVIGQLSRPKISPRTLIAVKDLDRAVEQGVSVGWHVAIGENRPEITSVAAALRMDGEGYFFCVGGPTQRLAGRENKIGALIAREAAAMAEKAAWT